MGERWFLVPMSRGTGTRDWRFPSLFATDSGPPLVDTSWAAMDMPADDSFVLVHCPDISGGDVSAIRRKPGVFAFPADLQQPIDDKRMGLMSEAIGDKLGPWLPTPATWSEILDEIMARLYAIQAHSGRNKTPDGRPGVVSPGTRLALVDSRAAIADRKAEELHRRAR